MKDKQGHKSKEKQSKTESKFQPKGMNVRLKETFALGRMNYILMVIGLVIIFIGYALMVGGGSENPEEFNPGIFSFVRLDLSVIIIIFGYLFEIYAIMRKPKKAKEESI